MGLQYSNVPEKDFSRGIDARSSENQIEPGFAKDLLNADIVGKRARRRPGYQGYAGNIPVRVTEIEYKDTENQICFTLSSSISLEQVTTSPLVVYGKTSSEFSSGDGPFYESVNNVKYYPGFTVPIRRQLFAGTNTLVIPGAEHGLDSTNLFCSVVESTSLIDRSYSQISMNNIQIDESSFDVSIQYTIATDTSVFVFLANKDTDTGQSYVHPAQTKPNGPWSISIPAGTHALSNFNIISEVYQDTGSAEAQIFPDSMEISSSGDVTISGINGTGGNIDIIVILSSVSIQNSQSGTVNANSTGTVTISNLDSPWLFYGIFLEQTAGGTKEQVLPDSIEYNDSTGEVTLSFVNNSSLARNFIVFYEYGELRSNQLCVQDSTVTVSGSDSLPQLTIWGLDHNEIYGPKRAREGWVNHVDSYRRSGEQRLVSGLGGNLFSAQQYSESASVYAYALLYPRLNTRTSGNCVLGPTFWDSDELPERTRGYITGLGSGTHWTRATAVEYDTGNGWTKYTLSVPGLQILDSTGTPDSIQNVISTVSGLEDQATISGMSYSKHNGTFVIKQVSSSSNEIQIWVQNDNNSEDYNDQDTGGQLGIFTDTLVWSETSPYMPGDLLLSDALNSTEIIEVTGALGTSTLATGFTEKIEVPAGVLFVGERNSAVIPMRVNNPAATASVENLVRGDMLAFTGSDPLNNDEPVARLLRVLSINPDSDRSLNIVESAGIATATLQSGDTSFLYPGMQISLVQAKQYSGNVEILDIESGTQFTFRTEETGDCMNARMLGNTCEIDEVLNWSDTIGDSSVFYTESRWIPIEAPEDSYNQTPDTIIHHFDAQDYIRQLFLRSTMVIDNMYFTDGQNEVAKFDGTSIYRAGLPNWQPGLFLTQETTGATIVTNLRSFAYSAITASSGQLTISFADSNSIPVGQNVRLEGSTQTYTVRAYADDGTDYYLFVDRSLDGSVAASGTVAEIGTYRYYYRLNAVDVNDNIIASAVTGYQDHVVELTGNAAILHKIVGVPALDNYDYDRLEVEIYRTKLNTSAPFYKNTTLPMSFNSTDGYLLFRDSFADSDLTELDIVNTALKGAELGVSWSDPLRAKFVTSIGNKLVLGNLRDRPQLDIQISAPATVSNSDFAGDTLLFRRSNTDSGTDTDMVNRVKYEWKNGTTGTLTVPAPGSDSITFNTSTNTGTVPGDWIYLSYATVAFTNRYLDYSGWYQIASSTSNTVTLNIAGAAAAISYPDRYTIATDPTDVPVLLGSDGNLGQVNGDSFDIFDSMRRMAMALNASMRQVDTSLAGMEDFRPWLSARSGNDTPPAGRLIVRQPQSSSSTPELVPTFSGYDLFVNSVKRSTGNQISASTRVYPSRIIASYENYAEIFDNPTSILDSDSDSAIDINSADGQEITGIIPFFGEAAFGAAQQSAVLVVFKTNSIYLVDLNAKATGTNPVQRIETEGLGCTAPYSIAVTKGGIMFANESGIYCLRRSQAIQYIGEYMERRWTERVDLDQLDMVHGHHYGVGRAYKLSVPITGTETAEDYIENSEAYIYNHTNENEGQMGAWARYDNHPAIGWANLASNAFFASTKGRVFSIRNLRQDSDFRDDNQAIGMVLQTRPNDFGDTGRRKVLDKVIIDYRVGADSQETQVSYSIDTEEEYSESSSFTIRKNDSNRNGLSDRVARDIVTIEHSLDRRRGSYFSIQIQNSEIDKNIEIAGLTYKVGGLSDKGTLEAGETE